MSYSRESPLQRETRTIREYFIGAPEFFEFEKVIGSGFYGVACRIKFKERVWPLRPAQRFVVKRALQKDAWPALADEIRLLERLRGALHIVQPFYVDPAVGSPLDNDEAPTLYMEYLENGTIDNFLNRVLASSLPMPNRFLFRIFRCLLRACVAMAWPPDQPRGAPIRIEEIPDSPFLRNTKAQIAHNDIHSGNILIGDLDADEHALIPSFRLIDFGNANEAHAGKPGDLGVRENIRDVGIMMYTLIQSGVFPMNQTVGKVTLQLLAGKRTFVTQSTELGNPDIFPHLDPDLASLVMWCLAKNVDDAPGLEELFETVQWCCVNKTSAHYSNCQYGYLETSQGMSHLVQALIFDGDN